jgi:CMP-N-acetylneuraminic acid synthetase
MGKPLIQWSIEAALSSKCIDAVVVSSDSDEILALAKELGIEYLHKRSDINSDDGALMQSVVQETLEYMELTSKLIPSNLILLQPTSPLRMARDIDDAFEIFASDSVIDSLISYTQLPANLRTSKLMKLTPLGFVDPTSISSHYELPKAHEVLRNGPAICISRLPMAKNLLIHGRIKGFEMPWSRSIDIDTKEDFLLAEYYASKFHFGADNTL